MAYISLTSGRSVHTAPRIFLSLLPSRARRPNRFPACRWRRFIWAADSKSFWVIGSEGADQPVGRLQLGGEFTPVTKEPAMRQFPASFAVAKDMVAWVESDGKHLGTIWLRDRAGAVRVLVEPNPRAAELNPGTQEVVRWKNAHGEELQGILAKPAAGDHFPLVVDPYSEMPNRYFNMGFLGNYLFVREGYAVFFPDHRAPHGYPENAMGEAYTGAARDRDPIDVLVDDVMSGVNDLISRGIADPARLYLYSTSTGATSVAQLLTQTRVWRAAVAHGGVYDWIAHYERQHPLGDDTVAGFLHGRTPADSPDLYLRISPIYQVAQIQTPLLLVLGDKDETRVDDTRRFHEALVKAGSPAKLVMYAGEGHQLTSAALGVKHVRQAIEFFREAGGK
jgi:dipeptidyl aminopeptidase/acylaminoacyl peptidase